MTHEERKALREKHRPYAIGDSGGYHQCCEGCRNEDTGFEPDGPFYPCDVIKVLDWYERREEMEIEMALSNLREVFKTYPLIGIQNAIYALEGKL